MDEPRIALSDALAPGCSELDRLLRCHGYVVLRDVPEYMRTRCAACDCQAERLLTAHLRLEQQPQQQRQNSLRIPERSTRLRQACSQSLPLVGIGVNTVRDQSRRALRAQFHLLADETALQLVPWPVRRHPALRPAVEQCCLDFHRLAVSLLSALGGGGTTGGGGDGFGACLERERSGQVVEHGDPSVFDLFLYPNSDAAASAQGSEQSGANMRAHTDPGLLTLTLCSETPGLQVMDRQTGVRRRRRRRIPTRELRLK